MTFKPLSFDWSRAGPSLYGALSYILFWGPSESLIVADLKKIKYIFLHNTLNCNFMCCWGPSGSHRGPEQPLGWLVPWAGPAVWSILSVAGFARVRI